MTEMAKEQWSTSEAAKELGVAASKVRTWVTTLNWEVRRNAEGHRVFSPEDVAQLRGLKAWLDGGNTLKDYKRESEGEGDLDPVVELRESYRRLKELQSQQEALALKQQELVQAFSAQREALQTQTDWLLANMEASDGGDSSRLVQGVLKQLLSTILEKQGKLQRVRRFEEDGRAKIEYMAPTGKPQVIEDVVTRDEDRRLMEAVLTLILKG